MALFSMSTLRCFMFLCLLLAEFDLHMYCILHCISHFSLLQHSCALLRAQVAPMLGARDRHLCLALAEASFVFFHFRSFRMSAFSDFLKVFERELLLPAPEWHFSHLSI